MLILKSRVHFKFLVYFYDEVKETYILSTHLKIQLKFFKIVSVKRNFFFSKAKTFYK